MFAGSTLQIGNIQIDWMVVAFIALLIGIIITMYRAQKDQTNTIDIYDLVTENGRLSKTACVMMGAFIITSWMMVTLTINATMSVEYFLAYSATWITPLVTRIVKSSTDTTTTTTVKP